MHWNWIIVEFENSIEFFLEVLCVVLTFGIIIAEFFIGQYYKILKYYMLKIN